MAHQGKRGRGCKTCKARHIKCDETFPSCNRCKIAGRECPGLQREGDWTFKNETKAVAERAVAIRARGKGEVLPVSPSESHTAVDLSTRERNPSSDWSTAKPDYHHESTRINAILVPSKRDIALNHFVDKFIVKSNCVPLATPLLGDLALILRHAAISSPIYPAVIALGLSILGNYPELRSLKSDAAEEYCNAVHVLGGNIQDSAKSKSDETLLSVILLIIYEMNDSNGQSTQRFQNHNRGALAILRHKGLSQFDDPHSLHLFRAVRNHVVSNCVRTCTSLETFENDSFWYSDASRSQEGPTDTLSLLGMKLPSLRAQSRRLTDLEPTPATEQLARGFVADALSMEQDLRQWHACLPEAYQYEQILCNVELPPDMMRAHFWPGTFHRYSSIFVAYLVNRYRVMQLYLQEAIRKSIPHLPPPVRKPLRIHAQGVIQQMVDEISASVPYQLNMTLEDSLSEADLSEDERIKSAAAGAYYLIIPMHEASVQPGLADRQRNWLKGRLNFLAKTYGLGQYCP